MSQTLYSAPIERHARPDDGYDPFFGDPGNRPRRGCRPPPMPQTWDEARRRFQAGESAPSIYESLGIARTTFHERKRDEGWRRVDQPPAEAEPWTEDDEDDLPTDALELREIAWRNAARAICQGDRMAARAWLRTVRDLDDAQTRDAAFKKGCVDEFSAANETLRKGLRALGIDPDGVPLIHPLDEDGLDDWDYQSQRNVDLHRALTEARGHPDPYPGRPRPEAISSPDSPQASGGRCPEGTEGSAVERPETALSGQGASGRPSPADPSVACGDTSPRFRFADSGEEERSDSSDSSDSVFSDDVSAQVPAPPPASDGPLPLAPCHDPRHDLTEGHRSLPRDASLQTFASRRGLADADPPDLDGPRASPAVKFNGG